MLRSVTIVKTGPDTQAINFDVTDTGIRGSKHAQKTIFDSFYRVIIQLAASLSGPAIDPDTFPFPTPVTNPSL
jgi:hypothetical protein